MQFDGGSPKYFKSVMKFACKTLSSYSFGMAMTLLLLGCSDLYVFDTLNQLVHESRAVRRCYRAVRDLQIIYFAECSIYAQSHLVFFGISDESHAATGACIAGIALAIDERMDGLSGQAYTSNQKRDIAADCKHGDVDGRFVRNFLDKHYHMLPVQSV